MGICYVGISCYVGIACFVIIGSSGDVYDDGVELQTDWQKKKKNLVGIEYLSIVCI